MALILNGVEQGASASAGDASSTTLTPVGSIEATDLQAAIEELDTEKEPADATILKEADVDDVPVDSATAAPISSNWAYDHENSTAVHGQTDLDNPTFDTAGFTSVEALGTKTTHFSVDFSTSQMQAVTLTANTMTITFDTTTIQRGGYTLYITDGDLATITWAAETGSLRWQNGTVPTLSSFDIVTIKFDGTNFDAAAGAFSVPA